MRKIREVLRLKFEAKLSHERIAAATGISKGAVSNYVQRAIQKTWAGLFRRTWTMLPWSEPSFPKSCSPSSTRPRTMPTCIRSSSAKA
jgi:Sigma-70, region 4